MKLKRSVVYFALLIPFFLASKGTAQEAEPGNIARATINTPMPGMRAAYEDGVKQHHQWHREHKDSWTYNVWEQVSGPGTGNYVHRTAGHHWADFDQSRFDAQAHSANAAENIWKHRAATETQFSFLVRSLSTIGELEAPPAMVVVTTVKVKPGKGSQLMSAIRANREARKQVGKSREFYVNWLVNSGVNRTVLMVSPRENWADRGGPLGENQAVLTEVHGEREARLIMDRFSEAIEESTSAVFVHRPDLSYHPDK